MEVEYKKLEYSFILPLGIQGINNDSRLNTFLSEPLGIGVGQFRKKLHPKGRYLKQVLDNH